jgi:hypothetical protein
MYFLSQNIYIYTKSGCFRCLFKTAENENEIKYHKLKPRVFTRYRRKL